MKLKQEISLICLKNLLQLKSGIPRHYSNALARAYLHLELDRM